jgi:hypothetical protein
MITSIMKALPLLLLLAAEPRPVTVPAGTHLEAKLESSVKTASSEVGDNVVAIVTNPIRLADQIVVPRGSRLNGRVETIQAATPTSEGRVRLAFREIEFPDGRRVSAWITDAYGALPPKRGLRYALWMGTGAAAGALVGGKSARVAGILGGGLAGFVIAGNSGDSNRPNLTLRSGHTLQLRLGEDLKIP